MREPVFLIIDLFCGAGGFTEGAEQSGLVEVIIGINHDKLAIESHETNHPETVHMTEDIRTVKMKPLIDIVNRKKKQYPDALILLHASLECTNFSKAKGGQPRKADSRTLADHLDRYVKALNPDLITIENVVEFMSWGPLDDNGKPISRKNGIDWIKWRERINGYGYRDAWKELNSANYGAYTSRNRLFGVFAKPDLQITFPEPTHYKQPEKMAIGFHNGVSKWKPVREVLNLDDKGNSIFVRDKALSEKTLERIEAGLIKFVAGGKDAYKEFFVKYNSTSADGKVCAGHGMDEPSPVVSTQARLALAQPEFISKYFSGNPESKNISIDAPAATVKCVDNQALVQAEFLVNYQHSSKCNGIDEPNPTITCKDKYAIASTEFLQVYHGNGNQVSSIENPSPTIPTKDSSALVQPEFIMASNGGMPTAKVKSVDEPANTVTTSDNKAVVQPQFIMRDFSQVTNQSINQPAGSLLPFPKMNLTSAEFLTTTNFNGVQKSLDEPAPTVTSDRHHHYLLNPQYGNTLSPVDKPCFTIIARMDKKPPYLIETEKGEIAIQVYETDSPCTIRIKQFMALYGIIDIKMRMLRIHELLRIQGFPASYTLKGTQADQKKFIGNAVEVTTAKAFVTALASPFIKQEKAAA